MGTKKDDQEALWNFYGGRYVYYLDWSDSFPDKHVKFYEIVVFQSAIHCISVVSIKLFKKKRKKETDHELGEEGSSSHFHLDWHQQ